MFISHLQVKEPHIAGDFRGYGVLELQSWRPARHASITSSTAASCCGIVLDLLVLPQLAQSFTYTNHPPLWHQPNIGPDTTTFYSPQLSFYSQFHSRRKQLYRHRPHILTPVPSSREFSFSTFLSATTSSMPSLSPPPFTRSLFNMSMGYTAPKFRIRPCLHLTSTQNYQR